MLDHVYEKGNPSITAFKHRKIVNVACPNFTKVELPFYHSPSLLLSSLLFFSSSPLFTSPLLTSPLFSSHPLFYSPLLSLLSSPLISLSLSCSSLSLHPFSL